MDKIAYELFKKACQSLGVTMASHFRDIAKETIIEAFGESIYDSGWRRRSVGILPIQSILDRRKEIML